MTALARSERRTVRNISPASCPALPCCAVLFTVFITAFPAFCVVFAAKVHALRPGVKICDPLLYFGVQLGALILGFYNEKKVMSTIDSKNQASDAATEEAAAVSTEEVPATEENPTPVEEEAPNAEENPVPVEEEVPATEENPTPVEEEATNTAENSPAVEEEAPAVENEPTPVEEEEDSGMITKFPEDEEGE